MSNYVHNYVFCSVEAEQELQSNKFNGEEYYLGTYDYSCKQIDNGLMFVVFDTYGHNYRNDYIIPFIQKHKETNWFCVEENEIEEGWFFWKDQEVKLSLRPLSCPDMDCIMAFEKRDGKHRPYTFLIVYNNRKVIYEDILANRKTEWLFREQSINSIINTVSKYQKDFETDGCSLPEINKHTVERFGYWLGDHDGSIETLDYSDIIYSEINGYHNKIRYRPDILIHILNSINKAFCEENIDFQVSSIYLSEGSGKGLTAEELQDSFDEAQRKLECLDFSFETKSEAGDFFKNIVSDRLSYVKIRWDNGVITNKDSLLPVVKLSFDYSKAQLRVDYCSDLGGKNVYLTEYYDVGNADKVVDSILKVMDDQEWRNKQAIVLSFSDGYKVKVKDDSLHKKLFHLRKTVFPKSLRMLPLRKRYYGNSTRYRKKK